MIDKQSPLWTYVSAGQRGLIEEGFFLLEDTKLQPNSLLTDYSYLVFPFAKAYEGFLKQFFLDLDLINDHQYQSTHFRIGKVLNPNLRLHLGKNSVYAKLVKLSNDIEIADELWGAWKQGRNLLFHYFPHNLRAITIDEAEMLINQIVQAMNHALETSKLTERKFPTAGVYIPA